jgi:hypothetical protein
MEFISALQTTKLSDDIVFSIQHPEEKIRNSARNKAFESIDTLRGAGVDTALIFHLLCVVCTMMYAAGALSILDHRLLIKEYIMRIYDDADRTDKLLQQIIIQMSVIKAKSANVQNPILAQAKQTVNAFAAT